MPLQNRVTPFGEIVAIPERGLFMGNRGSLHDEQRRIVRSWATKRWITCRLDFRGRKRDVMPAGRWTALFFLDEATALAAGHRPCAECRREDYRRFRALWIAAFGSVRNVDDIDAVLDRERRERRAKRTYRAALRHLPSSAFIAIDGAPWMVHDDALLRWSPGGYRERRNRSREGAVDVLTPPSVVELLRCGYAPVLHSSASNQHA